MNERLSVYCISFKYYDTYIYLLLLSLFYKYLMIHIYIYIKKILYYIYCDIYIYMYIYYDLYLESRTLWEFTFLLFLENCNILKLKLQMKLCSCPLQGMYCLKKCPGVHSTLDKCYYIVPSTRHNSCRIC